MATATPNIMIKSISGRIGNLVFYQRRGIQCVRTYVIPRNPDTLAQKAMRRNFADAVLSWQSMTADERYAFTRKARNINMSGYNLYISLYMRTIISNNAVTGNVLLPSFSAIPATTFNRFPSVSNPYIKAYSINPYHEYPRLRPG